MDSSTPGKEEEVAQLIELFLDQLRKGKAPTPQSFAAAYPEFAHASLGSDGRLRPIQCRLSPAYP